MTTKHTTGPWSINGNKIDGNGYHIASINSHGTTEGKANARLIAAAPDLLAALEMVMEKYSKNLDGFAFEQVFQAIKKAKGE